MIFEKLQKMLKITKFCGDLALQDGTVLIVDANFFNVGVTVSVQTKDGLTPLPTGSYTLDSGDIINVVNGKVEEIISPVVNKPIPDPIVNRVMDDGGNWPGPWPHEQMLATDPTQTGQAPPATAPVTDTANSETGSTAQVLTLEEVSTKIGEIMAAIDEIKSRLDGLESGGAATTEVAQGMAKDIQTLMQKATFAKEIKSNGKLEMKNDDQANSRMEMIRKITGR